MNSPQHQFARLFPNRRACILVRAPGRVNLIGEHTDYNGYPVLPMALTRAITVVLAPREDETVSVCSPVREFGRRSFALERDIVPSPAGDWSNYAKAAAQSLIRRYGDVVEWKGFDALVVGDVPQGAGLSSSSALVVASALALLAANDRAMPATELAELLAEAEHYVGTAGGGMDQAVCLHARQGHALRIDFFPLRSEPVPVPEGYSVVVANSLVKAHKSGTERLEYNRRPLECRIAAYIIASAIEASIGDWLPGIHRLADLESAEKRITRDDLMGFADAALAERPYTGVEIARVLRLDVSAFTRAYLTLPDGDAFPEPTDGFKLKQRVRHVLSEATRVDRATEALKAGDLATVGSLMDESHASCRDDYEISTPELEALVAVMRQAGALGARLTGAGFGGCAVALAEQGKVPQFLAAVRGGYYEDHLHITDVPPPEFGAWDDVLFATEAGAGASVSGVGESDAVA